MPHKLYVSLFLHVWCAQLVSHSGAQLRDWFTRLLTSLASLLGSWPYPACLECRRMCPQFVMKTLVSWTRLIFQSHYCKCLFLDTVSASIPIYSSAIGTIEPGGSRLRKSLYARCCGNDRDLGYGRLLERNFPGTNWWRQQVRSFCDVLICIVSGSTAIAVLATACVVSFNCQPTTTCFSRSPELV